MYCIQIDCIIVEMQNSYACPSFRVLESPRVEDAKQKIYDKVETTGQTVQQEASNDARNKAKEETKQVASDIVEGTKSRAVEAGITSGSMWDKNKQDTTDAFNAVGDKWDATK
jgi:hypothetical protein